MGSYVVRRVLQFTPVWVGVAVLVFSTVHLMPGDPVRAMTGGRPLSAAAVARVIHRVFDEVNRVAGAYRTEVLGYEDRDFSSTGNIMAMALQVPFYTLGVTAQIKGPSSVRDRYITDDLPQGLAPLSRLAHRAGMNKPLIAAFVSLGSAVCDRDFRSEGRTPAKLGIDHLSADENRAPGAGRSLRRWKPIRCHEGIAWNKRVGGESDDERAIVVSGPSWAY
ncbi:MAG: NAD/NADP octopine/nopaline dehydrogenase family protein [Bacillota bacterium]|nr:NAD/NADP octopine/nopaline dehydrogenase family protein [Bacillota bacterium]